MAKIVLCEDEERIQKLVRVMLRTSKHELFVASNGNTGLDLIKQVHPDLILSDISMPECDGFQLADDLKANQELASIPIVFLSAFAQRSTIEDSYRHGGVSYITKPFSTADLFEKIDVYATDHASHP